jgi:Tol biopolymer transport system component
MASIPDISATRFSAMIGRTVSHYRVLRAVGGGGMGDVYEAEDLQLGRHVAIKFLTPDRAATPEARQRFEREARAASALNHPYICTVHEFGEHDGQRFIVMELLQGSSLRDRLNHHPLPMEQLLEVAIDAAAALNAAHRAGIVHRDVTPSNIFVTADGHAKVLDFGLAKMPAAPALVSSEASTETAPAVLTTPGAAMGTSAYMSPEQIAGEDLDSRTDVFSFGCVLYEMATGVRPFSGKTTALVLDAILHDTPIAPTTRNPALPVLLQEIIEKALEKDRNLRYADAGEVHRDLQRLKRDLSAPADRGGRWSPVARMVRLLALLVVVGGAVAAVYVANRRSGDGVPSGVARQITSSPGPETDPAISPDGRTIAYAAREGSDNTDIWMVDVRGGPPQRVTTNPANDRYASWFPDGSAFAFVSDRGGQTGIWKAPRFDGEAATLLVPDADEPAISPDGGDIAFVRPRSGYMRIAVAPVDDPGNARFLTSDTDGRWDHSRPAWSPDGEQICYGAWDGLWIVSVRGGGAQRLTTADARDDSEPAWSADGRFVYFTSLRGRQAALWRISREGGTPVRVTVGSGIERTPRVSRDGHLLAFSTSSGSRDLAVRDLAAGQETEFGSSRNELFPAIAPDGRKVYFVSDRWGTADIWSQDMADGHVVGAARRVLESPGVESHLAASADGQWLAYYRILNGRRDIFVVPSGGGTPQRITDDPSGALDPAWSPDGKRLAFSSERDGTTQIWVQGIEHGKPAGTAVRITSGAGLHTAPVFSPDATKIAYVYGTEPTHTEIAIVAAAGNSASTVVTSGADAQFVRWNAAIDGLIVSGRWGGSQFELRVLNPDGSVRQQAWPPVRLGTEPSALFDISSDGRFAVYPTRVLEGDIWILDGGAQRF